ncbi:hypothetical protein [Crenothrix sp.]|uniref:hypothetical protein n=1 Tax=Crenothrix sp. TaxID=3100433 RepID=UPI00374DD0E3
MNSINQLRFAVNDSINDVEVSPSHVSLALLGEFQKDVSEFLKGSNRDVDPSKVVISIENGSLAFVATGLLAATTLWSDLAHLKSEDSLNLIDSKRASIVERWQASAQKNPHRRYFIADPSTKISFAVDSTSNFRKTEDAWVHVEKYLHGTVVDMGGSTRVNVHLKIETGATLTIDSTQDLLAQGEQNRLYRSALLHVTAEENLLTGELRHLRLLAFENHQPSYDDYEFNQMVERGTQAWANVPDTTSWLEMIRGSQA